MINKSIELAGRTLNVEIGRMAKQADGAVLVRYADTVALVTAVATKEITPDRGFFPLSVEYREKTYAAGRIPGGFFKREGRPSEKEILGARLTDRPIRPLFPEGFQSETQIIINVLSADAENTPDILGIIGASAALSISDIPWNGPIAGVRVGWIDGKVRLNPTNTELDSSTMDIVVVGKKDSIVMVEGESDQIPESDLTTAIQYAQEAIRDIIELQEQLVAEIGKPKRLFAAPEPNDELNKTVDELAQPRLDELNSPKNKADRYGAIDSFILEVQEQLAEQFPEQEAAIKQRISDLIREDLRQKTLNGVRADGRKPDEIRAITVETQVLPRTHGSALFTRGETQALAITTLGSKKDEQLIDDIEGTYYKSHMLHYNFPPFSVGEVRPMRGTSRREIGHGNLAERALQRVLPDFEDFPYTVRIVSEILESNGSSSMATVCASCMALMDAGAPIKAPVAGIAMGLVMEDEQRYVILSDILGTEDHLGDMDFKVAGTKEGINSIQMDLKREGISIDVLRAALDQARTGRLYILDRMLEELAAPREQISEFAPRIHFLTMDSEKIGELIGPGGRVIKSITRETGCNVDVDDDGTVVISGTMDDNLDDAIRMVDLIVNDPVVGSTYHGIVRRIMDFGAFVEIAPGKEGLVHISELEWSRVQKVEDILKIGDEVDVKLIKIDDLGRLDFSRKALLKKPDGWTEPPPRDRSRPSGNGGARGGRPRRSGDANRGGRRPNRRPRGPRH
ncbi:MAG: polyribonucleotide nucleotidyltransferase [Fidelibacterota bacterium]|nr:MAG: polyribonucleotide nucleotidyltransferase [Candidatus Neomarinimicrobiota bacterium]